MDKLNFFRELGFSEYESKTLAAISGLNKATLKEISLNSGVPQNKLYSIIKRFESLSLIAKIPDSNKKYELINLGTFINSKIKEKQERLRLLRQNSKKIRNLRNVEDNFSFSLIRGQRAIMNKIAEKNPEVKREILGVQRNWKIWAEGIRVMEKTIKRGVITKFIGVINEETEKRAREWKKIGCNIRKYNYNFGEFPLRFSIFDNKEARITIGKPEIPNPEDYITIWTNSKPLINLLRKQFFEMWKASQKF